MSVLVSRFPAPRCSDCGLVDPKDRIILGKPLSDTQNTAVLRSRYRWTEDFQKAKLWIREDAYVTEKALQAFVESAQNTERPCYFRAQDRVGEFFDEISLSDRQPCLVWMPNGGEPSSKLLDEMPFLSIDAHPRLIPFEAPDDDFPFTFVELPLTDIIVLPTQHWAQLLWVNLMGLGPYLWRELVGRNVFSIIWNGLGALIRARSVHFIDIFAALRYRGKKCRIHPSAVVEGCWIGDNVTIGANAVVRGSILADGAVVEDLAMVEFSVLGELAKVQRQAMVKFSVLSDQSSVGGVVQLGVLGESASVKRGAYLLDMTLSDGGVQVLYNGERCPVPLGVIGCFVGDESTVGLGVHVAPGRAIPPRLKVTAPAGLLMKVSGELEGVVEVKDGSLVKR